MLKDSDNTLLNVSPAVLKWARERVNMSIDEIEQYLSNYSAWERGESKPSLEELEFLAVLLKVPFGYLLLNEPLKQELPIMDFRPSIENRHPEPDLIKVIYKCQIRQEWYAEYLESEGIAQPLPFVNKFNVAISPKKAAAELIKYFNFDLNSRKKLKDKEDFFYYLIKRAEDIGILVMVDGFLDFSGFAISHDTAPLVCINPNDTKVEQMFSLIHEIAHILLGKSGVSDVRSCYFPTLDVELWCSQVASEFFVPEDELKQTYRKEEDIETNLEYLTEYFSIDAIFVLRRLVELGMISIKEYNQFCEIEIDAARMIEDVYMSKEEKYYRKFLLRISHKFMQALVEKVLEGKTITYKEAYRMLDVKDHGYFLELAKAAGCNIKS